MKNIHEKNNILKLSLLLSASLITFGANAQENEILKRAGINVVNGFNLPGSPERVNTIRDNRYEEERATVGTLPANKNIQGNPVKKEGDMSSEAHEQYINMNEALENLNKDGKKALEEIEANHGVVNNNDNIKNKQSNVASDKKKVVIVPKKQIGPKVQEVGISHFNQETIKEMEAYGQAKQQEEYMKFRMEASQKKNPPIQIRKP